MIVAPDIESYEHKLIAQHKREQDRWWNSATYNFLKAYKLSGSQSATHTSFIGGKWHVPADQQAALHAAMEADMQLGVVLHVTERTGATFRFFVDMDFPLGKTGVPSVTEIVNEMQTLVPTPMICSTRTRWKLHFNFRSTIVDKPAALELAGTIRSGLQTAFPCVAWDEAIDTSVYASGLRMVGQAKPWCKSEQQPDKSWKLIPDGKWRSYYEQGTHEVTGLHWHEMPRAYQVYESGVTDEACRRITATALDQMTIIAPCGFTTTLTRKRSVEESTDNQRSVKSRALTRVSPKNQVVEIESQLAAYLGSMLKIDAEAIELGKVKIHENIMTIPINSRRCAIAGRDHSSNRIYCVVNTRSFFQGCHNETCKMQGGLARRHSLKEMPEAVRSELNMIRGNQSKMDTSFRSLISEPIGHPESLQRMDLTAGEGKLTAVGSWVCSLTKNLFCPVCDDEHERPSNYFMVNQNGHKCIGCHVNPFEYWPDPIETVSAATINVLFAPTTIININKAAENIPEDAIFPEEAVFEDATLNTLVFSSMKGWDLDLAKVFLHLADGRFGTDSSYVWWCYDDKVGRWRRTNGLAIEFCRENVCQLYFRMRRHYESRPTDDLFPMRMSRIDAIMKRLRGKEQSAILHQAAVTLNIADPHFVNRLDSNKDLLNFEGTVHDLSDGTVRPATAADMLSVSTEYMLPQDVDPVIRQELQNFVGSIMADKESETYMLTWLASSLDGHNREEIFTICTGSGRNGKGVLRDLMHAALGGYAHTVQAALFTHDRPSSASPCPDLLHCRAKRFISGSEPEKGRSLNAGFMKFFTGRDPISGRFLNENEEHVFDPQHSIMYLTNKVPVMDAEEDALWQRARILDFPFTFVRNPKKANEKRGDDRLKSKVKQWGAQFMLLLLEQYHTVYRVSGLPVSVGVSASNERVRKENDIYGNWVEDHIHEDAEGFIIRPDLWPLFKREYPASTFKKSGLNKALVMKCGGEPGVIRHAASRVGWEGYSFI